MYDEGQLHYVICRYIERPFGACFLWLFVDVHCKCAELLVGAYSFSSDHTGMVPAERECEEDHGFAGLLCCSPGHQQIRRTAQSSANGQDSRTLSLSIRSPK